MSEPRKYKGVYPAKGGGWQALAPKVNGKFKGGKRHLGHFATQDLGAQARCLPGETLADQRRQKKTKKGAKNLLNYVSPYKGVFYSKRNDQWIARVSKGRKGAKKYVNVGGLHDTALDAAKTLVAIQGFHKFAGPLAQWCVR